MISSEHFKLGKKRFETDLAEYFDAESFATHRQHLARVSKREKDLDLAINEARVLLRLGRESQHALTRKESNKLGKYIPLEVDSEPVITDTGEKRYLLVTDEPLRDYIPLSDVLKAYPNGLDYRDAVWMYKRILEGLDYTHCASVIHGAVLPSHVLICPENHGAKLIEWAYAVDFEAVKASKDPTATKAPKAPHSIWTRMRGSPIDEETLLPADPKHTYIKAISIGHKAYYPPEVFRKETPRQGTDTYMAAKCMVALVGGNVETDRIPDVVPEPIRALLQWNLMKDPTKRPSSAFEVHRELSTILQRLVGPPKFRPFKMPDSKGTSAP